MVEKSVQCLTKNDIIAPKYTHSSPRVIMSCESVSGWLVNDHSTRGDGLYLVTAAEPGQKPYKFIAKWSDIVDVIGTWPASN